MWALICIHTHHLAQWVGFSKSPGNKTSERHCDLTTGPYRKYWGFSLFEENYKYMFPMETIHTLSVLKRCNNSSGSWIPNGILVLLGSCCSGCFAVLCCGWGSPSTLQQEQAAPGPLCLCSAEEKAMLGIRCIWKPDPLRVWRLHLHQALQSI